MAKPTYPDRMQVLIQKQKEKKITPEEKKELDGLFEEFRKNKNKQFKPGNDFSWWNKVPLLLKDASNIKSNWIAGTPVDDDVPFTPAGVLRVDYAATYGKSMYPTDPINVWARDLWLRMFSKYRQAAFQPADLGICIMAQIEILAMVNKLERIYGVINRYSKLNVNMPYAEISALGLTQAEAKLIRDHLSDYRFDLNVLIRKLQRLSIPKDMSIVENTISLLGYEYLDHDNARGQIIIFDRTRFGEYDDTALTTGGSLFFYNGGSYDLIDMTADNCFPFLEHMIDQFLNSSGNRRICADLQLWFGADAMLQFTELTEEYVVVPTYSESILHKLHNMECIGLSNHLRTIGLNAMVAADKTALSSQGLDNYWIYQYNENIVTQLGIVFGSNLAYEAKNDLYVPVSTARASQLIHDHVHVLDTYRVEMDDETVTEGVLWKCNIKESAGSAANTYVYQITSSHFEVIITATLYTVSPTSPQLTTVVYVPNVHNNSGSAQLPAANLSVIDWAPLVYTVGATATDHGQIKEIFGDIDTVVGISTNQLARLQTAVIYSGMHTEMNVLASMKS